MPILIIWALLILYGLIAVYSVSIFESFQLSLKLLHKWLLDSPTNYFYFLRHLQNLLIALLVWWLVYKIPLESLKRWRIHIFFGALTLQLLVFTPLWTTFQWSRGWLYLAPFWTLQPVEIFKLAWILFLAWWLIKKKKLLKSVEGLVIFYVILGIFGVIYLFLPDLWALLILTLVSLILFWYAWWSFKQLVVSIVVLSFLGIWIGLKFWYIQQRFGYFLNPQTDALERGIWWQVEQWIIAIGAGWWLGRGYGKWLQKFGYIPEAQSDFIFAAFSEEVGFVGDVILLWLYLSLAWIALTRLRYVRDEYRRNVAVGIVALIMIQAWVNISVNLRLLPVTWLTLPFISYWGTSLMMSIVEIILLYKILYDLSYPIPEAKQKFLFFRKRKL